MNKEELESKFEDCFDANTRASEGGYGPDVTDKLGMWWAFLPIISDYAKQQAIAFDEWRIENRWFSFEQGHYYYTFEHGTSMSDATYGKHYVKTREELYSQFIEQQTKDK